MLSIARHLKNLWNSSKHDKPHTKRNIYTAQTDHLHARNFYDKYKSMRGFPSVLVLQNKKISRYVQCQVKNNYQSFVNRTYGWRRANAAQYSSAQAQHQKQALLHCCWMHIAINKQVSTERIIQRGKHRTKKQGYATWNVWLKHPLNSAGAWIVLQEFLGYLKGFSRVYWLTDWLLMWIVASTDWLLMWIVASDDWLLMWIVASTDWLTDWLIMWIVASTDWLLMWIVVSTDWLLM